MQGSGFHKRTHCFCSYLVHFFGFSCLVKNGVFLKISSWAFPIFRFTKYHDFLTNLASRGSFLCLQSHYLLLFVERNWRSTACKENTVETDDNFSCNYIWLYWIKNVQNDHFRWIVAFLSTLEKYFGPLAINSFHSKCKFKTFKFAWSNPAEKHLMSNYHDNYSVTKNNYIKVEWWPAFKYGSHCGGQFIAESPTTSVKHTFVISVKNFFSPIKNS